MASSSLAVLGQSSDPDSRIDAYNACLAELQQEERLQHEPDGIDSAIRLARKDLRAFETDLQQNVQTLALRFLSFVFSTDELVAHVSDQIVRQLSACQGRRPLTR